RARPPHAASACVRRSHAVTKELTKQPPFADRANDFGGHDRRLRTYNGHLTDAVLPHDRDSFGDRLIGMRVDQRRQVARLLAEHIADNSYGLIGSGRKAVSGEPGVAEDFGEVAAAGVG